MVAVGLLKLTENSISKFSGSIMTKKKMIFFQEKDNENKETFSCFSM